MLKKILVELETFDFLDVLLLCSTGDIYSDECLFLILMKNVRGNLND